MILEHRTGGESSLILSFSRSNPGARRRAALLGSLAGTLVVAALLAPLAPARAADGDGGGGTFVDAGDGAGGLASVTGPGGAGGNGAAGGSSRSGGGGGSGTVGGDGGSASEGGGGGGAGGANPGDSGGDGGDGEPGVTAGGGGGGGAHGYVGAISSLNGSVFGGNGGSGGEGTFGGGGGGGGYGAVITGLSGGVSSIDPASDYNIVGGRGGDYGWNAAGGDGGSGLVIYQPTGDNMLTVGSYLTGGNGGEPRGNPGYGGDGGSAFVLDGASGENAITFEGSVTGGNAGTSWYSLPAVGGAGILLSGTSGDTTLVIKAGATGGTGGNVVSGFATPGSGGAGIDATGSTGATLILVQSVVQGGAGGTGGLENGKGGAGITGANLGIILDGAAGSIIGGTQGSGNAAAIAFTGGTNVLELRADSSGDLGTITGAITGADGNDILVLAGSNNASVDFTGAHGTIAASGFGTLEKAGTSTWTVTDGSVGDGMAVLVSEGTLALTGGATLAGATRVTVNDTLDLSGLTSGTTLNNLSGAMSATIDAGAADLTLNQTTAGTYTGSITGTGTLTKTGSATLTLGTDLGYTGGVVISEGTLKVTKATTLADASSVTVNGTLGLDTNGENVTIANLSGTSTDAVIDYYGVLTVAQSVDGTYAGGFSGYVQLTKTGSAELTLTGDLTSASYVHVREGELAVRTNANFGDGTDVGIAGATATLTVGLPAGATAGDTVTYTTYSMRMDGNGATNTVNIEAGATFEVEDSFDLYGNGSTRHVFNISGDETYGSGVLETAGLVVSGGVATMNLDGGTLRARADNEYFLYGFSTDSVTLGTGGGTIDTNGHNISIGGVFTGSGALVKDGAGTLTLTGSNSLTGEVFINEGTLKLAGAGSIANASSVTVDGTLDSSSAPSTIRDLSGTDVDGSIVTGSTHLTIIQSNDATYAGSFSGTGFLNKEGTATLTLTGAFSTSNQLNVKQGEVAVQTDGEVAFGGISVAESSYNATLTIGRADDASASVVTEVSANNVFVGSGSTSGTINIGSGGVLDVGALQMNSAALGQSAINVSGNADDGLGVLEATIIVRQAGNTVINLDGGVLRAAADQTSFLAGFVAGSVTLGAGGGTIDTNGHNISIGGVFTGSGALVKDGAGTLTLSGANSHTGGTVIEAGTLAITDATALPSSGSVALNGETAVLDISGVGGMPAAVSIGALSGTATGAVVKIGGTSLTISQSTNTTYAGGFSGTGDLTKSGSGTLTLTGDFTYGGFLISNGGGIEIRNTGSADFRGISLGASSGVASLTVGRQDGDDGISTLTTTFTGIDVGQNGTGALTIESGGKVVTPSVTVYAGSTLTLEGNATDGRGVLETSTLMGEAGSTGVTFDGGVLRATGDEAYFIYMFDADSITLAAGGGYIDTNGYDIGSTGVFTGVGALVKQGEGTLTLSGANSHSGGTEVAGGTLEVTDGGALGTGAVNLSASTAVLELNDVATDVYGLNGVAGSEVSLVGEGSIHLMADSGTYNFAGSITGGGGLSLLGSVLQMGDATQILSGSNNFTGYIGVTAGTLVLANDAAASASNLVIIADNAQLTIDDVNVTIAGLQNSGDGLGTVLIDGGSLTLGGAAPATFAGTITGSGELVIGGTLTQTLTGDSDYTGGTTINAGATLQLGNGGLTGSLAGDIAVNGTLNVNRAGTLILAGDISGSGALVKTGTGTLILTGDNSYTGGTTISEGTLQIGNGGTTGSVIGSIVNNAALVFYRSDTYDFPGTITGSGTVTILGGTVNFTGAGGYNGSIAVEEASLVLEANSTTSSTFTVESGGTISGTGTIGGLSVLSGGTAAPGYSPGTITVAGDVSFAAGSTYAVEIWTDGTHDLISASGIATLSGGTVAVLAQAGYANPLATYTILTAQGGVSGAFDTVTTNYAYLLPSLSYDASNVYLTLARNDTSFASVAQTPNQTAAANAVESLGLGNAVYDSVLQLTAAQAPDAFNQLSGEVHASTQSLFMEQSSLIRGALNDRLRAAQGGVAASAGTVVNVVETSSGALAYAAPSPVEVAADLAMPVKAAPAVAPVERFALWSTAFGNWGEMDGNSNAAGVSDSTGGFLIGADTLVGEGWRVGVAGGYSYTDFSISGRNSSGSSDNWHIGIYGGNVWGPLALRTGLAYTWQDISTNRSVAYTGYSDSLSADYSAGTVQAFGELGYRMEAAGLAFEPFANLSYVSLDQDGYTEEGGAAALTGQSQTMDTTFTTLGLRLAKEIAFGSTAATLRGALGWRHAFGDIDPTVTQAFAGSDAFTVTGAPIAEDAAVLEAGLDMVISESATLGIAYTGQYGDGVSENGINARLSVRF